MKFIKYLSLKNIKNPNYLFLLLGLAWVALNIFFLPFQPWTTGIVRPWFMLNGYLPYRDFGWMRTPLDLFLLSFWYRLFGVSGQAYQFFVFTLITIITLILFLTKKAFSFIFYLLLLFPLFLNIEAGEIFIGLFSLLFFVLMSRYFQNKKPSWLFASGLIAGLALVTKQNSALIILAGLLALGLDAYLKKKTLSRFLNKAGLYFFAVILPFGFFSLYFMSQGAFGNFIEETVIFVLTKYSKAPVAHGEGGWIVAGYLSLLIPFILFWKKTGFSTQSATLLILLILALFVSLLPSFLSYRAFTAFPLVAIVAGTNIALFLKNKTSRLIIIISFFFFLGFISRFLGYHFPFVKDNGFHFQQYTLDYDETEYKIADWLRKNTQKEEKIINYGNAIIYLFANRLPKNKYIDPFPYGLQPYEKTSQVFFDNLPRIVVYDESLPEDHPGIEEWPFIKFMKENYRQAARFGENLVIYEYIN